MGHKEFRVGGRSIIAVHLQRRSYGKGSSTDALITWYNSSRIEPSLHSGRPLNQACCSCYGSCVLVREGGQGIPGHLGRRCVRPPVTTTTLHVYLSSSSTYDHRFKKIALPVRSAVLKLVTGGLVVRWVTTGESPLLYVFFFFFCKSDIPVLSSFCYVS
jgi:hypothetical protein